MSRFVRIFAYYFVIVNHHPYQIIYGYNNIGLYLTLCNNRHARSRVAFSNQPCKKAYDRNSFQIFFDNIRVIIFLFYNCKSMATQQLLQTLGCKMPIMVRQRPAIPFVPNFTRICSFIVGYIDDQYPILF